MPEYESMNGRYFRTCSDDIRTSPGWFKNVLLLGLVNVIPIFGSMTVAGYGYEWGHKAAWGVKSPMPDKIYGRKNSKMLRWGWFAIVITFVFWLIPYIISAIGAGIDGATSLPSLGDVYSHSYHPFNSAFGAVGGTIGGILQFIGWLAGILISLFTWVGIIRMTVYDRLGAGLQFKKVWQMATHDFGGLLRIFGMEILGTLVIGVVAMLLVGVLAILGGMGAVMAFVGTMGVHGAESGVGFVEFLMMLLIAVPLLIVVGYVISCMVVYLQLLVCRAVGYWCRQFDVAKWGTKDDPLPFEREEERERSDGPRRPEDAAGQEGQTASDRQPNPEPEPEAKAEPESQTKGNGPVGWRAAGTSASDKSDD